MIRALFRTRVGRYLEVGAEVAHELLESAVYSVCRQALGIPGLEHRVHDLEVMVDRWQAERERFFRGSDRFPRRDQDDDYTVPTIGLRPRG